MRKNVNLEKSILSAVLCTVLAIGFAFGSSLSFAQNDVMAPPSPSPTPAPTLKSTMKEIAVLVKSIAMDAANPALNSSSATKAHSLIDLFARSQKFVPNIILKMHADQQKAALAEYKLDLQKEIDYSIALEKAFLANDNTAAAAILQGMSLVKKEGHTTFNPPPSPTPH